MHLHLSSRSSCSILSSEQLINNLSDKIDGVCITDHGLVKPIKHLLFNDFLFLFGVEITCLEGDLLAYGINPLPKIRKTIDVIDFIHNKGGVAVCAHPYSSRHNAFGDKVFKYSLDAIELNRAIKKQENEMAKKAASIMNIPLIGGSDAHSTSQLNTIATLFKNSILTIGDIVREIKAQNCKPVKL